MKQLMMLDLGNILPDSNLYSDMVDEIISTEQFILNLKKIQSFFYVEETEDIEIFLIGNYSKFFKIKENILKRNYGEYSALERIIVEQTISILGPRIIGVSQDNLIKDFKLFKHLDQYNIMLITDEVVGNFDNVCHINSTGELSKNIMEYMYNFFILKG